jgi:mannosyl-glycoprotein endo-beta-N-acetylglucosaminidase
MKKLFSGKKLAALALVLALCLGMLGSASAAGFGMVTGTKSLNLRAAGSSSSEWKGAYPTGTWVEILGSQNNFYRVVTPDGKTGYMSKNFITTDSAAGTVRIATVNNANGGAFLNLRSAPSYSAKVLGILYNGVPLKVTGEQNGWYSVQLNGINGWVRSEFVRVTYMVGSSEVATIKTRNNSAMNLRMGPGKNYPVVRQFPGDTYVMVLAKGDGWWQVAANGYTGFMDASFLKLGLKAAADVAATTGSTGNTGSSTNPGSTGSIANGGSKPYAVVNNPKPTQALNLRQQPSLVAPVLRKLYNGTELWVTEQGAEWCAVITKDTGIAGYVMTKYTSLSQPNPATAVVVHPAGTYVNLRNGQSLNSGILMRVPHGRQVTVLSPGGEWTRVNYNGTQGYMLSTFLK